MIYTKEVFAEFLNNGVQRVKITNIYKIFGIKVATTQNVY